MKIVILYFIVSFCFSYACTLSCLLPKCPMYSCSIKENPKILGDKHWYKMELLDGNFSPESFTHDPLTMSALFVFTFLAPDFQCNYLKSLLTC